MTQRERDARSRGTMIQEVTREEVERAARTSLHLGDVLRQTVTGLQVRDTPSLPGARVCIEFRGRRSVRFGNQCQTPVLLLDGIRMHDPPSLYGTIAVSSIERIEVIPPTEAGLLY
jgi:outer membrane cobalamin receptor